MICQNHYVNIFKSKDEINVKFLQSTKLAFKGILTLPFDSILKMKKTFKHLFQDYSNFLVKYFKNVIKFKISYML